MTIDGVVRILRKNDLKKFFNRRIYDNIARGFHGEIIFVEEIIQGDKKDD